MAKKEEPPTPYEAFIAKSVKDAKAEKKLYAKEKKVRDKKIKANERMKVSTSAMEIRLQGHPDLVTAWLNAKPEEVDPNGPASSR